MANKFSYLQELYDSNLGKLEVYFDWIFYGTFPYDQKLEYIKLKLILLEFINL